MRCLNVGLVVVCLNLSGLVALAASDVGGNDECCHFQDGQRRAERASAKAWDEKTGRDLRNYPPDRIVDLLHMKLQLRFENLNDQRFSATESLTFLPIGSPTTALTLDAVNLQFSSVKVNGQPVEYSADGNHLILRFEPPIKLGEQADLNIDYVCDHPISGMIFTPSSPDAPDYSAEIHTQGECEGNRHWFVCRDSPNERMSTELIVDVPAGLQVSSNGKLISNLTSGDRAVWHYLQEKPHCAYLVSLIIGKFDIVEIPYSHVPLKVWVPQGLGGQVLQTYGRTGEMIDLFEKRFGIAYPWDRYDQICVKNFGAGGMENTSATTMYPTAILDKTALLDGDLDGLISHELCHQWTGDMITCKGWEDIWLNEGWATFGSALWNEQRFGQDGYLESIRGNFGVARRDKTSNEFPMCSNVWNDPGETFGRAANPYPKGSSILHMLRKMLGEDVFWKGVALYMNRFALNVAETGDFRHAMEEVSARDLKWFFEQWCHRPGCPELHVNVRYDGEKRDLLIDVDQTQKIDERTPAFRFTLPVFARTSSGEHRFQIDVDEKSASFRAILDGPPTIVAIDPDLCVLKTLTCDKPMAMWLEQAKSGPTIAARLDAIEALGKVNSPESVAFLAQMLRDDKLRYTLRNEAADQLAGQASPETNEILLSTIKSGIAEARVRSNLVSKLSKFDSGAVADLLAEIAGSDESYATRVAAIESLTELKAKEKADVILPLVDFKSQHDQVRKAALDSLAELDDPRGMDLAIPYAAYGCMDRSRPTAIGVIGKLAKHDKERAVKFLLPLLNDPEARTRSAAGAALADIGDERAIDSINAIAETNRDPEVRERAKDWLKRLREKKG